MNINMLQANPLTTECNDLLPTHRYWTDDKQVYFRHFPIKGADIESFVSFGGRWAKDKKHCYSTYTRLKEADPQTFIPLNLSFVKDAQNVWTIGGKIADADAASFVVCDAGAVSLGVHFQENEKGEEYFVEHLYNAYGYGKDKNSVFYECFQGKAKVLKKADPQTFVSLGDGYFGYDANFVFYGFSAIPKAKPKTWQKLHPKSFYSQDGNKIYYANKLIKQADIESFEIVKLSDPTAHAYWAKDKNSAYEAEREISFSELEIRRKEADELYQTILKRKANAQKIDF